MSAAKADCPSLSSGKYNFNSTSFLKERSHCTVNSHYYESLSNFSFFMQNFLGERCRVPLGYQLLPDEFFSLDKGIPPPLVSKSWIKLVREKLKSVKTCQFTSGEDSDEDSVPLAKLRDKFLEITEEKNNTKTDSFVRDNSITLNCVDPNLAELNISDSNIFRKLPIRKANKPKNIKSEKVNNCENSLIYRKRGRPKKSDKKLNSIKEFFSSNSDVPHSDEDDYWKDKPRSSDIDGRTQKLKSDTNEIRHNGSTSEEIDCIEHDYFKSIEDSLSIVKHPISNVKTKKQEKISLKKPDSKRNYPCLECGKYFTASSTLKNHKRIHNDTLLKCTECDKGFVTKYLLKCHMRIHSGDLFMCHKCQKGFTTAELLKVHSRGHTGDRPFVCNVCERSFPSSSNLSQHKQTHSLEKKFLCFQCGSCFSQKRCLDGHMLTHAEKNHICNVCGKLWARKSDLIEHMRVHTGLKPYCCSLCSQKFTQASSLKRHQIVHMDVKPIQCLTCRKMFKCQEYYKRHMRKHEKETNNLFNYYF